MSRRPFLASFLIAPLLLVCGESPVIAMDLTESTLPLIAAPPAGEGTGLLPLPEPAPLRALEIARGMVGTRYRFGGNDPDGFDCSGLVRYAYGQVGIAMPRTSREMYRQVDPVTSDQLQPGDLVFFRISERITTHVGIYAGDGLFLHAPSRGKDVCFASLADPYWARRLVRAGRWPGVLVAVDTAGPDAP